jgi:hypothetical protein
VGLYISTYGIKLEKLNEILNSASGETFNKIIEAVKNGRDNIDFLDEEQDSNITLREAIRDIIMGHHEKIENDITYYLAVIEICMTQTVKLPYEFNINYDHESNQINEYLEKDFNVTDFDINSLVGANPGILRMPDIFSSADYDFYECPCIGFLTLSNLVRLKDELKNVKLNRDEVEKMIINIKDVNNEDEFKGFLYQDIMGFMENVDYCIKNGLEMLTVCG